MCAACRDRVPVSQCRLWASQEEEPFCRVWPTLCQELQSFASSEQAGGRKSLGKLFQPLSLAAGRQLSALHRESTTAPKSPWQSVTPPRRTWPALPAEL